MSKPQPSNVQSETNPTNPQSMRVPKGPDASGLLRAPQKFPIDKAPATDTPAESMPVPAGTYKQDAPTQPTFSEQTQRELNETEEYFMNNISSYRMTGSIIIVTAVFTLLFVTAMLSLRNLPVPNLI